MSKVVPKRRIIRQRPVLDRTGYSRSRLYVLINQGKFPKPIKLGERAVGWIEDEVDAHIDQLIASRDHVAGGAR